MHNNKGEPIIQWCSTVMTRVSKLPPPYCGHFEGWMQKQIGTGPLDSTALASALEDLDSTRQQSLMSSIQAILQATEQTFGEMVVVR